MIESWPENHAIPRASFDRFKAAVQTRCTDVRFAFIGGEILVVGTVRAYADKTVIADEARHHGIEIQNCVRVVPGHDWIATEELRQAG